MIKRNKMDTPTLLAELSEWEFICVVCFADDNKDLYSNICAVFQTFLKLKHLLFKYRGTSQIHLLSLVLWWGYVGQLNKPLVGAVD